MSYDFIMIEIHKKVNQIFSLEKASDNNISLIQTFMRKIFITIKKSSREVCGKIVFHYLCFFSAGDLNSRGPDLDVHLRVFVGQLECIVEHLP